MSGKKPTKIKRPPIPPGVPVLTVRKGATLREIYARAREQFSAADLQKYTELDEGIPMEQLLAEAEAVHRQEAAKRQHPRQKAD